MMNQVSPSDPWRAPLNENSFAELALKEAVRAPWFLFLAQLQAVAATFARRDCPMLSGTKLRFSIATCP